MLRCWPLGSLEGTLNRFERTDYCVAVVAMMPLAIAPSFAVRLKSSCGDTKKKLFGIGRVAETIFH